MKRKMLLPILLIICLSLYLIPFNRTIDKSYSCMVLDQLDETFLDEVHVTFTGTYSDYLIRKDKFTGHIGIDGYEFMNPRVSECTFTVGEFEENFIHEYINHISYVESNYLGTFYAAEDLDRFFLWIMIPTDSSKGYSGGAYGRYFITFPEMTFDEIYSILDKNNT